MHKRKNNQCIVVYIKLAARGIHKIFAAHGIHKIFAAHAGNGVKYPYTLSGNSDHNR